jgi:hypothetical protein
MFVLNNDYQCFIVALKNKSKKRFAKGLFKRKKVLLLHPQQRRRSFKYWQVIEIFGIRFLKKNIKKSL